MGIFSMLDVLASKLSFSAATMELVGISPPGRRGEIDFGYDPSLSMTLRESPAIDALAAIPTLLFDLVECVLATVPVKVSVLDELT
jgi:hypothetical protein